MQDLLSTIIWGVANSINITLVFIAIIEAVIIIGLLIRDKRLRYISYNYDVGKLFFGICTSLLAIALVVGLIPTFPINYATTIVGLGLFWLGMNKFTDAVLSPQRGL
jgi:hypothetical protein